MIRGEFQYEGKTYPFTLPVHSAPPATVQLSFRPCFLKPPRQLELVWVGWDDIRGVELYRPLEKS